MAKRKITKDKQRSTKHAYKTIDLVTRTALEHANKTNAFKTLQMAEMYSLFNLTQCST
jgi:hypothetical protein